MFEIPIRLEDHRYEMNPLEDDVALNATLLSNGMVVLLEDSAHRSHNEGYEVRKFNRWCRIEQLELYGNNVFFVGVYGDGTKFARRASVDTPWLFKIGNVDEWGVVKEAFEACKVLASAIPMTDEEPPKMKSQLDYYKPTLQEFGFVEGDTYDAIQDAIVALNTPPVMSGSVIVSDREFRDMVKNEESDPKFADRNYT